MRARTQHHRAVATTAIVAAIAAIGLVTVLGGGRAQAAAAAPGDGTTSTTAGASCWGIKQQYPGSADGIYWLNTAALERPQQFWCDMTTDGGGWVLVGRGRDGWSFNPGGQGSPSTVRSAVDGPSAFAPAALSTETITALLGGQDLSTLPDGIRLERAISANGANRQRYTLFPKGKRWTWSLPAGQLLAKVVVGSTTYNGSNTQDTAASVTGQTTNALSGRQGTDRLWTYPWSSHNNRQGFGLGSGVNGGSNASTNYLWTAGTEGYPLPFTRVWVRPKIANSAAGFSPIPAAGFPAAPKPVQLKDRSEFASWGVVGLDHTNETTIEPWYTNVLSMRISGDRAFIGGRFTGVQNGPAASPIAQPYLAAFDLDGNWISTFRPQVNGRVWDMVMTADGKLIIAGDFTSVNGQPDTAGMAALDPQTGAVITSWKAKAYRADGSRSFVRALDIRGTTIYAAGNFNRLQGGTWSPITVTNAASVSAVDGSPGTWRPRPNGSTNRLRVTKDGTRVLMAGYFTNINGDANQGYFGITDATTGNPIAGLGPWQPSTLTNKKYQQAVADLGDGRIVVGGSEHDTQLYDWNRTTLLDAAITKQGGDTQVIEQFGTKAFVGCHCGDWVYQGTNDFSAPSGFRSIEPINLVGQWDTTTWEYDTTWYPSSLKGSHGEGIWTVDQDSRSCVWVGGDLVRGGWSGNAANDWLGGFARFCPQDVTPPTAPSSFTATVNGSGIDLAWGAATDASGTVSYDIYRDDRVIATVWGTSYTDPEVVGNHRYTVRATDARGNQSASPAPISVNGPSPVIAAPIALGSTWRYLDTGADAGTAWRASGFDDSTWASGPGRFGWGKTGLTTTVGATKPLTTYFRRTFTVADPSQVKLVDLKLIDMQGAVVYVNGVEAGRLNMPAGAITATTGAAGYLSSADEGALKSVAVPGSLLVSGTNTIAVEVHNVTAGASRMQFDLQATLFGTGSDTQPPSAPVLSAQATGGSGVQLNWTSATDDVALGGYVITRDGQPLAVTSPAATGYLDGTVDTSASHTYAVTAFDGNGNTTPSATVTVAPVADPNLLALGSTWRWFYAEGGPTGTWTSETYDDSGWSTGKAELGYGDNDEATVISTAPTPRPLTAYFRTTVNVADPAAFATVVADLIRDDGAVVYVNGVEVGRDNMPAGPVTFSTPASTIISDRTQERTPVTLVIPSSAFKPGPNTVAVEVHNSDRWSGDLSFDLRLIGHPK